MQRFAISRAKQRPTCSLQVSFGPTSVPHPLKKALKAHTQPRFLRPDTPTGFFPRLQVRLRRLHGGSDAFYKENLWNAGAAITCLYGGQEEHRAYARLLRDSMNNILIVAEGGDAEEVRTKVLDPIREAVEALREEHFQGVALVEWCVDPAFDWRALSVENVGDYSIPLSAVRDEIDAGRVIWPVH